MHAMYQGRFVKSNFENWRIILNIDTFTNTSRVHVRPLDQSDTKIIQGFLNGEQPAHDRIVGWISTVISTRLWIEGISADDISSDTILKLLLNLRAGEFRQASSLKTYVQKVTRFTIVNAVRRHVRARRYARDVADDPPGVKTPLEIAEEVDRARIFSRIFSLIDERCREIWHLIFNERLQYGEIGHRLGLSESAVKTRVFRCKEEAIRIRKRIS